MNLTEEEISSMSRDKQLMCRMIKTSHTQELLVALRTELLLERGAQLLDFSGPNLHQAVAASAWGLAKISLLDEMIKFGIVISE